jgi:predicted enzyme related to lactoylglutathione lyase
MTLYAIRIFVFDFEQACEFYENKLGLTLLLKDEVIRWAEFDVGGAKLAIEEVHKNSPDSNLVGRFIGLSLQVQDVFKTHEKLTALGIEFTSVPQAQEWGGILAHFRDSSGNILTLMSKT